MGKPVISRYGLMANKTQDYWISFKNCVYQVPFTEKRPQNAGTCTGIKNVLEELGHEFPCGTFQAENRTTFSYIPLLPEIFLVKAPKNRVRFTF